MNRHNGYFCTIELGNCAVQSLATGDQDTRTEKPDVAVGAAEKS